MISGRLRKVSFILIIVIVLVINGCQSETRNIILTGYWPPSNQMLVPFSPDKQLNPAGWHGNNWRGFGYNVYAFFPTFHEGTTNHPEGHGDFEVDYQDTFVDFQKIVKKYKPIAIICYGMGKGPWEIEQNAVILRQWRDDYQPPTQPDIKWINEVLNNGIGHSTLPTDAIASAVNQAGIGVQAWVDKEGDPGDFLCNYIACLAAAYQQEHHNPMRPDYCAAAGFIHLGAGVSVEQAVQAQIITLETVLKFLEKLQ